MLFYHFINENNNKSNNKPTMEHLTHFTSIISLLSVKHPESKNQLLILRQAIVEWYGGVEEVILGKNKEIRKLQEKPSKVEEKLAYLLKEIQQYFDKIKKYYDDPNLNIFQTEFYKILKQFQFLDVDFDKFKRYLSQQVQTQPPFQGATDWNQLIKIIEVKQEENKELTSLNNDLVNENQELNRLVRDLQRQIEEKNELIADTMKKINILRDSLEQIQRQVATKEENQQTYRSFPELKGNSPRRKFGKYVFDALEEASLFDVNEYQEEKIDQNYHRMILTQSIAIEQLLSQVQLDQ